MKFTAIKATEIEKRPRKGGGSNRYQELAKAVGNLEIGEAIPVTPEDIDVEADMTDVKDAERFRSNVASAMKRLVGSKLGHRHRVVVDVHGSVVVERAELLPTKAKAVKVEDEDEDETEEGFDEI